MTARLSVVLVLGVASGAVTAADLAKPVLPYSRAVLASSGKVLSEVAISTPHPVVKGVGYAFKGTELALDIGAAGVEAHETWLATELLVVGDQAKRLHEIKASGGDLNGAEATRIKGLLRERGRELGNQREGTFAYTMDAVAQHWGYVAAKVGIKKVMGKAIKGVLKTAGIARFMERRIPLPKKVNWVLNYGGPLERAQKDALWGRLGTRARLAEAAASKAMLDLEAKLVAEELRFGRSESLKKLAESALGAAYAQALRDNPSRSVVVASDFRLVAARAVEPVRALLAASPVPARAHEPIQPIQPIVPAPAQDPVIQAIANDDAAFVYEDPTPYYERTASYPSAPAPEHDPPPPPPQPEPPPPSAWALQIKEDLKRVGDGKTFQVCSNGCPATTDGSWDGARGQSILPPQDPG